MLQKDTTFVLGKIAFHLRTYSESNPKEEYLLLLEEATSLIAGLRESALARRPKKKHKGSQFNYGAASSRPPGGLNVTVRSRRFTSNANLQDPGALEPEERKSESATEDEALGPEPPEEVKGESPTGTVRTPQPLGPAPPEGAKGESATEDRAWESKLPEEARDDSAIEGIRTPQPLESEPLEEAKDDPTEENTIPSQPLRPRLLVPNEATVKTAKDDTSGANSQPLKPGPLVSGKAESLKVASTVSAPQAWGPEPKSGKDTTVIGLALSSLQSLPIPSNVERLPPKEATIQPRSKLKLEIDDCKKRYHGTNFVINNDTYWLCVEPHKIEDFFHRFEETVWFSDRQLMPLIASFNWPSTTLVLISSYAPQGRRDIKSLAGETRWPLNRRHYRVILPYCNKQHWTLFDSDLRHHVFKQYDSMADNKERLAKLAPLIEERLSYAMAGWHNQKLTWTTETKVSQMQENNDDCGIFMVYNAHCLASKKDPLEETINGIELRYRYLVHLRMLEVQGRTERQVTEAVLGRSLKLKRRRVPDDISDDEVAEDKQVADKVSWVPPSHLGSENKWVKARDYLAMTAFGDGGGATQLKPKERAEELLHMIEAIGCAEVFAAWDRAIAHEKGHIKLDASSKDPAKAICQLIEQTQGRSFKDKVITRLGKWMFTLRILQDIETMRREASIATEVKGKAPADGRGQILCRAIDRFLYEAHPELQETEQRVMHNKYRQWWCESQIWVRMYNLLGAGILLLIPDGHCTKGGQRISTRQFVRLARRELEPFIEVLGRLRPDLMKTVGELDQQLEILREDVTALLKRVAHRD